MVLWFFLPVLVAVGTAYLVWIIMQARMRVLAAQFQAALVRMESEHAARKPTIEDLLAELHFERNRFLRRINGPAGVSASVISQERIYFRDIPITGWMQDELPLGDGEELLPLLPALPDRTAISVRAGQLPPD
jgi:hypothetical protein